MFDNSSDTRIGRQHFLVNPKSVHDIERLKYWDDDARQAIAYEKEIIERLQQYRAMLADRAQEISSAPYSLVLSLKRRVNYYDNKKSYTVSILRRYAVKGIDDKEEYTETFPGNERHKAFARFAELQKQNPGITVEKDIAKSAWER